MPLHSLSRRSSWRLAVATMLVAMLAACGSAPPRPSGNPSNPNVVLKPGPAPSSERDGADANPPTDLASVPDAEPRVEPIRTGGPNKRYEVMGREYVPITQDSAHAERGLASWYGKKFHGRRTASGEVYNMYAMTAAHPTLPIPSYVRVRNPANKREIVVRINDRGPFHPGRIIDLSYAAAFKLGVLRGVAPVELVRITFDEIRAGTWRKDAPAEAAAPAPPAGDNAAEVAVFRGEAPAPLLAAVPPPAPASPPTPAPEPAPAVVRPAPGFWVQLGVFRQRDGAESFHRRIVADVDWLAPLLAVFSEPTSHRLQAGPYATREEANGVASRVKDALKLVPLIVERR